MVSTCSTNQGAQGYKPINRKRHKRSIATDKAKTLTRKHNQMLLYMTQ